MLFLLPSTFSDLGVLVFSFMPFRSTIFSTKISELKIGQFILIDWWGNQALNLYKIKIENANLRLENWQEIWLPIGKKMMDWLNSSKITNFTPKFAYNYNSFLYNQNPSLALTLDGEFPETTILTESPTVTLLPSLDT